MRKVYITILLLCLPSFGFSQSADFKKIHYEAFVIDGHNDAIQRIISGEDLGKKTNSGHLDIPRMRTGGIDAAFFAVWVPPSKTSKTYFQKAKNQIESFNKFIQKYKNEIGVLRNYQDIEKYRNQNKLVAILSMEGAHPLGDNIKNLDYFYNLGIRSIMPTWNNSTGWATSAADEKTKKIKRKGLSELGKKFIKRMNELGIIIDVSHAGEQTFWDIIQTSTKPVIASHSAVWKICPHRRNLKDEQIKAIAKTGGLIAVNFAPWFLDSTFTKKEKEIRNKYSKLIDSIRNDFKGNILSREFLIGNFLKNDYEKILPTVKTLVDHIDYIVQLVGIDYVGLGSDYDGIGIAPLGLEDASYYPNVTKELLERGYSEEDIRKILGENFMRVLRQVLK